jgi:hypothetical protein
MSVKIPLNNFLTVLDISRPNFRPRTLDYSKPISLISDINEVFKKEDNSALNWVGVSQQGSGLDSKALGEQEIKRILDLFDKKKNIVIPKSETLEKKDQAVPSGEGKFSINENYKQTQFERPKHYIVYSHRSHLDPKTKDYEATTHDINFLKYENITSIDVLEKIISELENDINKGEMIPTERIKEIISRTIHTKSHVDKICQVSKIPVKSFLNYII